MGKWLNIGAVKVALALIAIIGSLFIILIIKERR